ncbi:MULTISPECIES: Flp pilus assembly protein CpaB [unclassified Dehalobacter]|uniref:Flp pilus assembly protein CpaB n=1 Tax=unclassified Dehalobacter TaxID=2635733 RepID=UPI001FAA929C|nr:MULTISPECIES: Flp pilus assembly protein CpaB [unclassified Dehalobacter]
MVKRKFYVFMAIISGLIFSLAVFFYLNYGSGASSQELKPLVVAAADISSRSILKADQLQIKQVPLSGYPQGGASTVKELTGRVLLVDVSQGDVLLSPMLGDPYQKTGSSSGASADSFSLTVPSGKRAVAIPVDLVGSVSYKVKAGDHVDVLITMDIKDSQGNQRTITSLAAQDVLVLNTGETILKEGETAENPGSYILALSVSQSMSITLGGEKGSIRLLLRNPANKETYTEAPIDPNVYTNANYFNHYK